MKRQVIRHIEFLTRPKCRTYYSLFRSFSVFLLSAVRLVDSCCSREDGASAGWMELCQAWLHNVEMMLAVFPLEHEPVGRKGETLSSLNTRPGQGRARPLPQEHKAGGIPEN